MLTQDQAFDDRYVWSLLADELSLLLRLNDTGRLRFAILLEFRQVQGLYPESINEFPSRTVHAIAEQIGCTSVLLKTTSFREGMFSDTEKYSSLF